MRSIALLMSCALLLLLNSSCAPANQEVNADNNVSNDAAEVRQPEPEPKPREASYPYQVNAELARVYLKYNIVDEAMRLYELAIQQQLKQTNTEDAENWTGLGDALKKAGRPEEAATAYERAMQIYEALLAKAGTNQLHNFYLGRLAALAGTLGMNERRIEYLSQLKADENEPSQQLELARIFQQLGNAEKAEQHFKRALELTTESPAQHATVKVAYGSMLFAAKRYDDALPLAKEAMDTEEADNETRKAARRLVFELYEARGDADKLEFKD